MPAKTLIPAWSVTLVITTAFSGGTPTIDVGDGDNPDGWIDNTDVTEGTAGAYTGTENNTAAYAAAGKYYSSADTIDAVLPDQEITAGEGYVFAYMINVEDVIDD